MIEVGINLTSVVNIIKFVDDGILIPFENSSGNFLILRNSIDSIMENKAHFSKSKKLDIYCINESHPLYQELIYTYKINQVPAILLVKNAVIKEIYESPITKSGLINLITKSQTTV